MKYMLWIGVAGCSSVLALIAHELGHYFTAIVTGASSVKLHWAYVSHDSASVSAISNSAIALAGPFVSCLLIVISWLKAAHSSHVFIIALGFAASTRNLLVLPYTIKTILGHDTSSFFFDEIRAADALSVSAFYFVPVTLVFGIFGTVYFLKKAYSHSGLLYSVSIVFGVVSGIVLWSFAGPFLLPGGVGIN